MLKLTVSINDTNIELVGKKITRPIRYELEWELWKAGMQNNLNFISFEKALRRILRISKNVKHIRTLFTAAPGTRIICTAGPEKGLEAVILAPENEIAIRQNLFVKDVHDLEYSIPWRELLKWKIKKDRSVGGVRWKVKEVKPKEGRRMMML